MNVCQMSVGGSPGEFEIRLQILCRENVGERFAPNDAALADGIFENSSAVTFAPKFAGQFFYLVIALWIIRKARRVLRARTDDGRAGTHEITHPLQHRRRHVHIAGRQNQHGVVRAAGQRDASVLHRRTVQQHIGVDGIIVVTGWQGGIPDAHHHRRAFAGEVTGVRNGATLLQQKFAARNIFNP